MTEVGWPPEVGIFYEIEINVKGGFSRQIEFAYTYFWDCCWEDQMQKMR